MMLASAAIFLCGHRVLAARHPRWCEWRRDAWTAEQLERKKNHARQKSAEPETKHRNHNRNITKLRKKLPTQLRICCCPEWLFVTEARLRLTLWPINLVSGVFARLGRGFLIVALSLSIGAPWAALQSVAWASMLVEYSQHASVAKAIAQTFDGQHPCILCKQILARQNSPKKDGSLLGKAKPDLICATRTIALLEPSRDLEFSELELKERARYYSPPTPPPRFGLS